MIGRKIFLKKKKGSALILAIIIVMIMTILCSSIMVFTLSNFRLSANYRKVVGGYYSSEQQLEDGLKELQDRLKQFDSEARKYITGGYFKNGTNSIPYTSNYVPVPDASYPIGIGGNLQQFFDATYAEWMTNIKTLASTDQANFVDKANKFLAQAYRRYYFLLIYEEIGNNSLGFPATATISSYKEYFIKEKLKSDGSTISTKYDSDPENNDNHLLTLVNDYSTDFNPTDKCYIKITYKKNDSSSSGKKLNEATIHTDLKITVPDVKFVVKNKTENSFEMGGPRLSLGNAINAYKSIIIKNNAKVTINGDVFAGADYSSTAGTIGHLTPSDPSDFGYSSDTDLRLDDVNAEGVRVGAPNSSVTAATAAKLNVNGTIYTSGYLHTVGQYSEINVKKYPTTENNKGYSTSSPFGVKNQFTDFEGTSGLISDSTYSGPEFDIHKYSTIGGDVFCQNLSTEETAKNSKINIENGRVFDNGNLQTDGESSQISVPNGNFYGLQSGDQPKAPNQHSCVIQNDDSGSSTITLGQKVFIPSTAYEMISSLKSGNENYQTAESITSITADTLEAYQNQSRYLSYLQNGIDKNGDGSSEVIAGAALIDPVTHVQSIDPTKEVTQNTTNYDPFSFYDFGKKASEGKINTNFDERLKHFVSYYTEKDGGTYVNIDKIKNKASGITLTNPEGTMLGAALVQDPSDSAKTIMYSPTVNPYQVNAELPKDVGGNVTIDINLTPSGDMEVLGKTLPKATQQMTIYLNSTLPTTAPAANVTINNNTGYKNLTVYGYITNDSAHKVAFNQSLSGEPMTVISKWDSTALQDEKLISDTWYDSDMVRPLANSSTWKTYWSTMQNRVKTELFDRFVDTYYTGHGVNGKSNIPDLTGCSNISKLEDVVLSKDSPVTIETSGVYIGSSTSPTSFKLDSGGIILTNRDVTVEPGVTMNGTIITTGNIIFEPGLDITINYSSNVYKNDGTKVDGAITKSLVVARALGLTVNATTPDLTSDITINGIYRYSRGASDPNNDNMSRFTRTEWKEE